MWFHYFVLHTLIPFFQSSHSVQTSNSLLHRYWEGKGCNDRWMLGKLLAYLLLVEVFHSCYLLLRIKNENGERQYLFMHIFLYLSTSPFMCLSASFCNSMSCFFEMSLAFSKDGLIVLIILYIISYILDVFYEGKHYLLVCIVSFL